MYTHVQLVVQGMQQLHKETMNKVCTLIRYIKELRVRFPLPNTMCNGSSQSKKISIITYVITSCGFD